MLTPAPLPIRGVANAMPYIDQPGDVTALEGMLNMRPRGPDDRLRLAQRPALVKLFERQLTGPVQAISTISRASRVSGYRVGACENVTDGDSRVGGALSGNCWALEANRGMFVDNYIDASGFNGSAGNGAQHCAVAPASSPYAGRMVYASNFTDLTTGKLVYVIRAIDPDGTVVWSTKVESGFTPKKNHFANPFSISRYYCWVASREVIDVIRLTDGVHVGNISLNGWGGACLQTRLVMPSTGNPTLYAAFQGAKNAGTYVQGIGSGIIQQGKWAQQFRSGVVKHEITAESDSTWSVLFKVFGTQLAATDPYFENTHGYFRWSEQTSVFPIGRRLTAFDVSPDGANLYICGCNRGWGPNNQLTVFHPKDPQPFFNVMKVNSSGVVQWEVDFDSVREVGDGGYINDIPISSADDPTVLACLATDDAVYLAGRRNQFEMSVYKVDPLGFIIWGQTLTRQTLPSAIRESCISIDPTDGNIVLGGDRNASWRGATGNAHLWKVSSVDGTILWDYDLESGVSALGVVVLPDGKIEYCTDKV